MLYEIYARFNFVNLSIDQFYKGADRAECIANIESAFNQSLAESWEILSEGPING
jgi:hypothetical protein